MHSFEHWTSCLWNCIVKMFHAKKKKKKKSETWKLKLFSSDTATLLICIRQYPEWQKQMVVPCFRRRHGWESLCSTVHGKMYFWIGTTSNLHFTIPNCCSIFFFSPFTVFLKLKLFLCSSFPECALVPLYKSQIKILVKCCLILCYIILAERTSVTCGKLTVIAMKSKFKRSLFKSRMIGTATCGT